jgi:hypothetical protein
MLACKITIDICTNIVLNETTERLIGSVNGKLFGGTIALNVIRGEQGGKCTIPHSPIFHTSFFVLTYPQITSFTHRLILFSYKFPKKKMKMKIEASIIKPSI